MQIFQSKFFRLTQIFIISNIIFLFQMTSTFGMGKNFSALGLNRQQIIQAIKTQNDQMRTMIREMAPEIPTNFSKRSIREMATVNDPLHPAFAWSQSRRDVAQLIRDARSNDFLVGLLNDRHPTNFQRSQIPRVVSDEQLDIILGNHNLEFPAYMGRLTSDGWDITMTSRVQKMANGLPPEMRSQLESLFNLFRSHGPRKDLIAANFWNHKASSYSPANINYHCHLGKCASTTYVAYWDQQAKSRLINGTFFGTHEASNNLRGGY